MISNYSLCQKYRNSSFLRSSIQSRQQIEIYGIIDLQLIYFTCYILSGKFCPVHIARFILYGYIFLVYIVCYILSRYVLSGWILSGLFCPIDFIRYILSGIQGTLWPSTTVRALVLGPFFPSWEPGPLPRKFCIYPISVCKPANYLCCQPGLRASFKHRTTIIHL